MRGDLRRSAARRAKRVSALREISRGPLYHRLMPAEALACFLRTKMDLLVLGHTLVVRSPLPCAIGGARVGDGMPPEPSIRSAPSSKRMARTNPGPDRS